ncbi:hypothetical protein MKW92_036142, partial [Papaver armeniacum]
MEKTSLLTFQTGLICPIRKKSLKNFWVEEKIHEKWKANKRNMRLEHFDEKKTDAQNRASCPNEVIDTLKGKY